MFRTWKRRKDQQPDRMSPLCVNFGSENFVKIMHNKLWRKAKSLPATTAEDIGNVCKQSARRQLGVSKNRQRKSTASLLRLILPADVEGAVSAVYVPCCDHVSPFCVDWCRNPSSSTTYWQATGEWKGRWGQGDGRGVSTGSTYLLIYHY